MAAMLKRTSIVQVHPSDKEPQAIVKSRAGNTTKIHLAVDSYSFKSSAEKLMIALHAAPGLIARLPDAKAIVAVKAYDSECECIREQITKKGARAVIPRKRNSLKDNVGLDWGLYKYLHLVEKCFCPAKALSGSSNTIRQTEEKF